MWFLKRRRKKLFAYNKHVVLEELKRLLEAEGHKLSRPSRKLARKNYENYRLLINAPVYSKYWHTYFFYDSNSDFVDSSPIDFDLSLFFEKVNLFLTFICQLLLFEKETIRRFFLFNYRFFRNFFFLDNFKQIKIYNLNCILQMQYNLPLKNVRLIADFKSFCMLEVSLFNNFEKFSALYFFKRNNKFILLFDFYTFFTETSTFLLLRETIEYVRALVYRTHIGTRLYYFPRLRTHLVKTTKVFYLPNFEVGSVVSYNIKRNWYQLVWRRWSGISYILQAHLMSLLFNNVVLLGFSSNRTKKSTITTLFIDIMKWSPVNHVVSVATLIFHSQFASKPLRHLVFFDLLFKMWSFLQRSPKKFTLSKGKYRISFQLFTFLKAAKMELLKLCMHYFSLWERRFFFPFFFWKTGIENIGFLKMFDFKLITNFNKWSFYDVLIEKINWVFVEYFLGGPPLSKAKKISSINNVNIFAIKYWYFFLKKLNIKKWNKSLLRRVTRAWFSSFKQFIDIFFCDQMFLKNQYYLRRVNDWDLFWVDDDDLYLWVRGPKGLIPLANERLWLFHKKSFFNIWFTDNYIELLTLMVETIQGNSWECMGWFLIFKEEGINFLNAIFSNNQQIIWKRIDSKDDLITKKSYKTLMYLYNIIKFQEIYKSNAELWILLSSKGWVAYFHFMTFTWLIVYEASWNFSSIWSHNDLLNQTLISGEGISLNAKKNLLYRLDIDYRNLFVDEDRFYAFSNAYNWYDYLLLTNIYGHRGAKTHIHHAISPITESSRKSLKKEDADENIFIPFKLYLNWEIISIDEAVSFFFYNWDLTQYFEKINIDTCLLDYHLQTRETFNLYLEGLSPKIRGELPIASTVLTLMKNLSLKVILKSRLIGLFLFYVEESWSKINSNTDISTTIYKYDKAYLKNILNYHLYSNNVKVDLEHIFQSAQQQKLKELPLEAFYLKQKLPFTMNRPVKKEIVNIWILPEKPSNDNKQKK